MCSFVFFFIAVSKLASFIPDIVFYICMPVALSTRDLGNIYAYIELVYVTECMWTGLVVLLNILR